MNDHTHGSLTTTTTNTSVTYGDGIIWSSSTPVTPRVGEAWYDTSGGEVKVFNGKDWVTLTSGYPYPMHVRKGPKWHVKSKDEETND